MEAQVASIIRSLTNAVLPIGKKFHKQLYNWSSLGKFTFAGEVLLVSVYAYLLAYCYAPPLQVSLLI